MARVLIAEDEPRLAAFLEKGLRSSGFTTTVVGDGPRAASTASESDFDLMILDLGLPGKDGLEVLRELRATGSRLPVIILTARDDTRPGEDRHVISIGGITLDLRTRWVSTGGAEIELSAREFELLRTFLEHPNQVLSREQLLAHVWGYDYDPGSNVVDVYVGYLRRKLGARAFETVRGVGYRYRA